MYKKLLLTAIFIMGVFVLPNPAKAYFWQGASVNEVGTTIGINGTGGDYINDNFTLGVTNLVAQYNASTTLSGVEVEARATGTCASAYNIGMGIPFVAGTGSLNQVTTAWQTLDFDLTSFNISWPAFFRTNLSTGFGNTPLPSGCALEFKTFSHNGGTATYIKGVFLGQNSLSNSIELWQPQNNSTTTDFSYWITNGTGDGAGTYETGVVYYDLTDFGINTSTPTYTDRGTSYSTTTSITFPFRERVQKKVSLVPEHVYSAYAYLMKGLDIVATSTTIQFGGRSGIPGIYPSTYSSSTGVNFGTNTPTASLWNDGWCKDTSFSVLGADFGKGVCKVFAFLFAPGEYANLRYEKLISVIQIHAPFSYFYDVNQAITNLSPTSTSTPSLTVTTGTSTPIQVSFTPLSSNSIEKYTTSTSRTIIRNLIKSLLYFAFAFMCLLEARHLFKNSHPNTHK